MSKSFIEPKHNQETQRNPQQQRKSNPEAELEYMNSPAPDTGWNIADVDPVIAQHVAQRFAKDEEKDKQVQQKSSKQGNNVAVNSNPTLEKEADVMGAKAAKGGVTNVARASGGTKQAKTKQDVVDGISQYDEYIKEASEKYGVSVNQIKAIIAVESNGKKDASSGAAFGLMQITKGTWEGIKSRYPELKNYDFNTYWTDPKVNILMGTAVFKAKMKTVGVSADNENFASLAITAYNAGEGTVKKAMQNAKNAGSKDPEKDCLKPEYLKPSIEHYGIYSYYLTGTGKKWNKSKTKEEAIQLKYKEISRYPGKVNDYLAILEKTNKKPVETKKEKPEQKTEEKKKAIQETGSNTYIVKRGEGLGALAAKFKTTEEELKKLNASKLKKWGKVEGFNAGEKINIPSKAPKLEISDDLYQQYSKGEMDMIEMALAAIPLCKKDPAQVLKLFNKLPGAHKDNLAYAITSNSDDAVLSSFHKGVLLFLASQLNLEKTSPANWLKYAKHGYRLGKIVLGFNDKEKEEGKKKDNKKTIGEKRKELALEAYNNDKDQRLYGWDFEAKKKGEKVDCSYYVKEVEATLNSKEARKIKQEKGYLTPAELRKYSTTFSNDRLQDKDISKYTRGTQQMAAILKKHHFYSTKLEDVKEGDYVFTGSGTSKEINTISHVIIITKIEVKDGKKVYHFADSGLSGAKKNKETDKYEGGERSVRNDYSMDHNGNLLGYHHFKGVGR